MTPLRIAHVAPVATTIPPLRSGSVEPMTSLLTEGLVAKGHDVTLWAGASPEDFPLFTVTREVADGNQASSGDVVLKAMLLRTAG